jgi:hypothetical protein
MVVLASSVASCEYKEGKYRVLSITIVVSGTPLPAATYLAVAFKLSRFVSVSPNISKPTNFSSALIRAPVSSYEGKKSKSNEGKKLGYTFWKVLLESSTRGVATSVNIHIGFQTLDTPFSGNPLGRKPIATLYNNYVCN